MVPELKLGLHMQWACALQFSMPGKQAYCACLCLQGCCVEWNCLCGDIGKICEKPDSWDKSKELGVGDFIKTAVPDIMWLGMMDWNGERRGQQSLRLKFQDGDKGHVPVSPPGLIRSGFGRSGISPYDTLQQAWSVVRRDLEVSLFNSLRILPGLGTCLPGIPLDPSHKVAAQIHTEHTKW